MNTHSKRKLIPVTLVLFLSFISLQSPNANAVIIIGSSVKTQNEAVGTAAMFFFFPVYFLAVVGQFVNPFLGTFIYFDNENGKTQFVKLNKNLIQAQGLTINDEDLAAYNSEIDELNAIGEKFSANKNLSKEAAAELWNEEIQQLSSGTQNVLLSISQLGRQSLKADDSQSTISGENDAAASASSI